MRKPFRSLTVLLTAAVALTAIPHAASAHAPSQNPPRGCANKEAASGNYSARVTICLTETWKKHAFGGPTLEPTDTVTLECWHGVVLWSNSDCSMDSKLTLSKDGVRAWTEERSNSVYIARNGNTSTYTDHYACRGNGEYELRFEGATVWVTRHFSRGSVTIPAFSVKARGCA
ncbi:hypothetical protein [Nonomuraea sp. JJY05]|jgi:hypothetical protein|uniref:hypothetical protein n=1 Tax=Nonomuraea sp. JJY05 TaxID=3350255 RepID=UPI00373E0D7E